MKRIFYWLPPIVWMGVIFYLSTDEFSSQNTGSWLETILDYFRISLTTETLNSIHFVIRKAAHLAGYGILTLLFYRAVRSGRSPRWNFRTAVMGFVLATAYAIFDEVHQSFTQQRTASTLDVMVDGIGGIIALVVLRFILTARDEAISQARLRSADR